MFLLSNERILSRTPTHQEDLPFQPGELYVMKYMGLPTVVTVLARTPDAVTLWFGTLEVEELNQRVLFRLGRRCKFLGMWLPLARCQPERVVALGLEDNLGTNSSFWNQRNIVLGSQADNP
jgi:hypothetical protein